MAYTNDQFRVPPHDHEAECSVLGALLLDKQAIIRIVDIIGSRDFYYPAHQKIYEAILELYERGEPIDIITLSSKLKDKNLLAEIGGSEYLAGLVNSVPTSAHITHYATIVKEKKVRRDLIHISSVINEKAFEEEDFQVLLDSVEQKVFGISEKSRVQKFTPLKEELTHAYERIEKLHQNDGGGLRGIPTGFASLDNMLSGLQRSDLVILGARPSYGKTSLALDIARNAALHGFAVGIFSIEMSREQIVDRLISSQAQIPLWRLRTGRLQGDLDFALIQQALDELSKAKLFIEDASAPDVLEMRALARRLQMENGLDLIVIDYLQLMRARTRSDNVVQQVSEISRGLKGLAKELNVPVLALSQLSRSVEQRDQKTPRLSDLRESGSLEQDADVVMFIHRKDRLQLDLPQEEQNLVDIIVAKHRNGPVGSVQLRFDAEKTSFRNIDTHHGGDFQPPH